MSWEAELWRLVAEREKARADERDALDQEDFDAARSAADRRSQAELALEKVRAKRRERP